MDAINEPAGKNTDAAYLPTCSARSRSPRQWDSGGAVNASVAFGDLALPVDLAPRSVTAVRAPDGVPCELAAWPSLPAAATAHPTTPGDRFAHVGPAMSSHSEMMTSMFMGWPLALASTVQVAPVSAVQDHELGSNIASSKLRATDTGPDAKSSPKVRSAWQS